MRQVLLDTDIVSEILKGRNLQVVARSQAYLAIHPKLTFTSVTSLEVLYGLERIEALSQIKRAEELFAVNNEILPDRNDYRLAAKIAGALDRMGRRIGLADPLIAACAVRRAFPLATGNETHFGFIKDAGFELEVEKLAINLI